MIGFERFGRFQHPVAEHGQGQRRDNRSLQADHRVDPLADVGVLLEVAGIDQVHAPRPGDAAVDHHDLAVQAKVVARDDGPQQSDRQGGPDLHARLAEPLGLSAAPPRPRAHGIDQHAAGDAPPGGADQRLKHFVGRAAFVPNVELHQHAFFGAVNVRGDRPQNLL